MKKILLIIMAIVIIPIVMATNYSLIDHQQSFEYNLTQTGAVFNQGAFEFDGVDDYLNLGTMPLVVDSKKNYSIYVKYFSHSSEDQVLIGGDRTPQDRNYFSINSGFLVFGFNNGTHTGTASVPVSANTNYSAVGVMNDGVATVYLDGVAYQGAVGLPTSGTDGYRIGATPNGAFDFNGTIYEIRIYDKALTQEEINSLTIGNDAACDNLEIYWSFEENRLICQDLPVIIQSTRTSGYAHNRPVQVKTQEHGLRVNQVFNWSKNGVIHKEGIFLFHDEFGDILNTTFWSLQSGQPDVWTTQIINGSWALYKNATSSKLNLSVGEMPSTYVVQFRIRFGEDSGGSDLFHLYLNEQGSEYYRIRGRVDNNDIEFYIDTDYVGDSTEQLQPWMGRSDSGHGEYDWMYTNENGYIVDNNWTYVRYFRQEGQHQLWLSRDGARWLDVINYTESSDGYSGGGMRLEIYTIESWIDNFIYTPDLNFTISADEISVGDNFTFSTNGIISSEIYFTNPFVIGNWSTVNEIPPKFELIPWDDAETTNITVIIRNVTLSASSFEVEINISETKNIIKTFSGSNGDNITFSIWDLSQEQLGEMPYFILNFSIKNNTNYTRVELWREENIVVNTENLNYDFWVQGLIKFLRNGYLNLSTGDGYMDLNPQMNHHWDSKFTAKNEINYFHFMKYLNYTFGINLDTEIDRQFEKIKDIGYDSINGCAASSVGSDPEALVRAWDMYQLEPIPNNCWYNKTVTAAQAIVNGNYNSSNGNMHESAQSGGSYELDWHDGIRPIIVLRGYNLTGNTTLLSAGVHTINQFYFNDAFYNENNGLFYHSIDWNGTGYNNKQATITADHFNWVSRLLEAYELTGNQTYLTRANESIDGIVNNGSFNYTREGQWKDSINDDRVYYDYQAQAYYALFKYRILSADITWKENEVATRNFISATIIHTPYNVFGGGQHGELVGYDYVRGASSTSRSENDYKMTGFYQSAETTKGSYYSFVGNVDPWSRECITTSTGCVVRSWYDKTLSEDLTQSTGEILFNGTGIVTLRGSQVLQSDMRVSNEGRVGNLMVVIG